MNIKKLFLVRHADYSGSGADPVLSDFGKRQSITLGQHIRASLGSVDAVIWTSSAARAEQTAQLIKQQLPMSEIITIEKLWSDNGHPHDFNWLKQQLENFTGDALIIVSHLEYVQDFPFKLGFGGNDAGYAQGVLIENGKCQYFG